MIVRRVARLAVMALASLICISCGQVYRPVVIPISVSPPNSGNFHAVFAISANAQTNPGSALQIDVSGDSDIGQANMGINPTHAGVLPNDARIFVASAGSTYAGQSDVITAFTPAASSTTATGLGNPTVFTLPNTGPLNGNGVPNWTCSYLPDYITTTQSTLVYVANYGTENIGNCSLNTALPNSGVTDSIAQLSITTNTITNLQYLPPATHPVAMAETANAENLYVVSQADGVSLSNVIDLSPIDLSTLATIPVGVNPEWIVARPDSLRVYVLTATDGNLVTINTITNTVIATNPVGVGANFILYDPTLNRLYVTNPSTGNVFVFSATGGANDTPTLVTTISMTGGATPPCPTTCSPVSITALKDGSRFYVASYESLTSCPDPVVGSGPCIVPILTVFNAVSLTVKPVTSTSLPGSPSLSLLASPDFAPAQYAVPPVSTCASQAIYNPANTSYTRFRMFAAAAADSSHVYVSMCDAGAIADVDTTSSSIATGGSNTPDTLILDLLAPFGACSSAACNTVAAITSYSVTSNVATFQAANSFTQGTRVILSGLSSTEGQQSIDGTTCTVLAAGLSSSQFECVLSTTAADIGSTADSGTAVPQAPPQSPIFLLTGQ